MSSRPHCRWIISCLLSCVLLSQLMRTTIAAPYLVVDPARNQQSAIVLQFDVARGTGFDWKEITNPRVAFNSPEARLREAVMFLQDGIRRMTGVTLEVRSDSEVRRGIVIALLGNAPAELRDDPVVRRALRNDGSDAYNDREAFFLRSEPERLIILANTVDGLSAAMPALLESVGYEVLGMGPNWIHVPTDRQRLAFDVELADRAGFYLRQITPTSGQQRGVGTIMTGPKLNPSDPRDESVTDSYTRWAIGIRNHGHSMAAFPGHAMYQHHHKIVEEMLRTGSTEGFLTAQNHLGLDAERPAAAESNASHLWINTDAKGQPGNGKVFVSNGKAWAEQKLVGLNVNANVSTPFVRGIVFDEMKRRAAKHFAELPGEVFVFGTEPEDGAGYQNIGEWLRPQYRNWYPEYVRAVGRPFQADPNGRKGVDGSSGQPGKADLQWPRPYVLHGYRGIDQPVEKWDYATPADVVFGFNNWLLREFDGWIDSLPEGERFTKSGRSKKELVRCSCYSYALHDIPPHINLDPRIRVMIAGYPKHRGLGEWKQFASHHDMAAAFQKMLPREPSGDYRIPSIAYYADHTLDGLPARWSAAPARIVADLRGAYDGGMRAMNFETDFNFGKYGLAYYLMSKVLWNARLTAEQLDAIRDRWLQRSFGSGWREMKAYYDFMLVENYSANAPGTWAKAIRLIDAADAKIDPAKEPDAKRRLDDVKQYWYWYYLLDTERAKRDAPELVEFLWKGQMSYMTAMHMAVKRTHGNENFRLENAIPESLRRGPAHYTTEETTAWWQRIHEHWPEIEVFLFADALLSDGRKAREIDLNDLVRVADFQSLTTGKPLQYNSAQAEPYPFLATAKVGETIGFKFAWPANRDQLQFYGPKDVPYGIEWWDAAQRQWIPVVDVTATTAASQLVAQTPDGKPRHVAEVRYSASRAGTYRIEVGRGGFLANLASLGYDVTQGTHTTRPPQTFFTRLTGLTQDPVYFYIPKGTKSLDLENWRSAGRKQVQLHRGVNARGLVKSRTIDIDRRGTHRITLESGEDGQLAQISGNGFAFPLLYSVPSLWSKCPAELLIPRAIAEADGLKIVE